MEAPGHSGPCSTCGRPTKRITSPTADNPYGEWEHPDAADQKYCDEVAKPARVQAILDELQAERLAGTNG